MLAGKAAGADYVESRNFERHDSGKSYPLKACSGKAKTVEISERCTKGMLAIIQAREKAVIFSWNLQTDSCLDKGKIDSLWNALKKRSLAIPNSERPLQRVGLSYSLIVVTSVAFTGACDVRQRWRRSHPAYLRSGLQLLLKQILDLENALMV